MTHRYIVTLFSLFLSLLLFVSCEQKEIQSPVGPVENTSVHISDVMADPAEIATSGYTSMITAIVRNDQNELAEGEVVHFSEITSLGSLSASTDTTSPTGRALSRFTAGDAAGTARILVTLGAERDTVNIAIKSLVAHIDTAYADSREIVAGNGLTQITARIVDTDGAALQGLNVNFTELTDLGNLSSTADTTDASGYAYSEFTANSDSGTARIRVNIGDESDTITVRITEPNYFISLATDQAKPLADGESQVKITVSARDEQLDPITNLPLRISSDNPDVLSPRRITTNTSGDAELYLMAPASTTDVPVEIYAMLAGNNSVTTLPALPSPPVSSDLNLNYTSAAGMTPVKSSAQKSKVGLTKNQSYAGDTEEKFQAAPTAIQENSDTLDIVFSGINLTLSSSRDTLMANGTNESNLTITALRANGDPIGNHPITLDYSLGVIPDQVTTNAFGQAFTTFTAGIVPGTAQIRARIGEISTDVLEIELLERSAGDIILTSSKPSIRGDGESNTTITATVADNFGDPLSGQQLHFQTDLGTLSHTTAATTDNGQASVTLTAPVASADQIATVTVSPSGSNVGESINIGIRGLQIILTSTRQVLPANNTSETTITAQLKELTNNSIVTGKTIRFGTTHGSIQGSAATDSSGEASVRLIAGSTEQPDVQITASYRNTVNQSKSITFIEAAPTYISLAAAPPSVFMLGATGIKNSIVTAHVTDMDSVPIQDQSTITFSANRGHLTSPMNPEGDNSVVSVIYNGEAQAVFHSDTVSSTGIVSITASTGGLTKTVPLITVVGAEPANILLGISGDGQNMEDGTYQADVSAVVEDVFGNPVGEGTMVYFSLVDSTDAFGVINPSAPTNEDGVATVQLTYPSDHVGETVRVRAVVNGTVVKEKEFVLPS